MVFVKGFSLCPFSRHGPAGTHSFFGRILKDFGKLIISYVGHHIRLQICIKISDKSRVFGKFLFCLRRISIQKSILPVHTGYGALALFCVPVSHKGLCVIRSDQDFCSFLKLRIYSFQTVVRDCDSHTTYGICQNRDGIHINGAVSLYGDSIQQIGDSFFCQFTAFARSIAESIGKTDMIFAHAQAVSFHIKSLYLCHRISGYGDKSNVMRGSVPGHQKQRVSLAGVRLALSRCCLFSCVHSQKQEVAEMVVIHILFSLPGHTA